MGWKEGGHRPKRLVASGWVCLGRITYCPRHEGSLTLVGDDPLGSSIGRGS